MSDHPTLYEWAGGREAFDSMINAFYDRVERDDLLSAFFPGGVHEEHRRNVAVTAQLAQRALRVRMFGSAAIDLAWLAHGRTDAAIISGGKPWDIAAGIILVREAGGTVTDALGSRHTFRATTTVATSPHLLAQILNLMGGTNANDARS